MALLGAGLVTREDSLQFGFAFGVPQKIEDFDLDGHWDNPTKFVWGVGGDGSKAAKYIANAVRKLRPLLRVGVNDTLEIRECYPEAFMDEVESVREDGTFPWGDFGWGVSVFMRVFSLNAQPKGLAYPGDEYTPPNSTAGVCHL